MNNLGKKSIIVKLGGSVITLKDKFESANIPVIRRIISELLEVKLLFPLIIVHGGGSFGHPHAYKYKLHEGFKNSDQLFGVVKTREAMLRLNSIVCNELLNAGFQPFPFQPSSFIATRNGEIEIADISLVEWAMKLGFTPVLYGDIVLDYEHGFYILSGDKICSYLVTKLNVERVVFACDVDGIYTSDPKRDPAAKLVRKLTLSEISKFLDNVFSTYTFDVTGGMRSKLIEARKIVSMGVEVRIVNALIPGRLISAIRDQDFYGSKVVLN
ncbi:MAG: isopentenyl phosphate kinase [Candidatus Methanomethylicia archaeon]